MIFLNRNFILNRTPYRHQMFIETSLGKMLVQGGAIDLRRHPMPSPTSNKG